MYIDKLDDIVNKCNNKFHRTTEMKPVDVTSNTYINSSKKVTDKDHKFKVGNHVRISKYKNIFAKGCVPNWSEEAIVITKDKNSVPWTYIVRDLKGEELVGTFYKKEFQKQIKKSLERQI